MMMLTNNIEGSRNNLMNNHSPTIQLSPGLSVGVSSGGHDDDYIYDMWEQKNFKEVYLGCLAGVSA